MKSLRNVGLAAVLLVAIGVVDVLAGTISLQGVGGGALAPFRTPPASGVTHPNDVLPELWGYLNGNLVLNGDAGAQYLVEFTLIGSESGWTNQLKETGSGGNAVLNEPADFNDTISYVHTATGVANDFLKFQFETIAGSAQPILVNGLDPGAGYIANGGLNAERTFFVSFCIDTTLLPSQQKSLAGCNFSGNATTGDVAWLALDDSGAGPNNDHDDWVGYLRATRIPTVPDGGATAGLLGAALLALGALRQRFSA